MNGVALDQAESVSFLIILFRSESVVEIAHAAFENARSKVAVHTADCRGLLAISIHARLPTATG